MCCICLDYQKKEGKYERFIDFTFDRRRVDFPADVAIAAPGHIHLSEACLSGQGQEENTGERKLSKAPVSFFGCNRQAMKPAQLSDEIIV